MPLEAAPRICAVRWDDARAAAEAGLGLAALRALLPALDAAGAAVGRATTNVRALAPLPPIVFALTSTGTVCPPQIKESCLGCRPLTSAVTLFTGLPAGSLR